MKIKAMPENKNHPLHVRHPMMATPDATTLLPKQEKCHLKKNELIWGLWSPVHVFNVAKAM
jgi:hypothetical protein